MIKILFLLSLVFPLSSFSQKVMIQGTALDSTKGRNRVLVILNDTLRKFREGKSKNWEDYEKLIKNDAYSVWARSDGSFEIKANKTDTLFFSSYRHIPKAFAVSDLLKMKRINIRLAPEVCIPFPTCYDSVPSKLFIFVGERINLGSEAEPYYCNRIGWDSRFRAQYKILEQIKGSLPKDTIDFTVFDHYGIPAFSKYPQVLLFVSEHCGKLFHQKYQFFEIYKTMDGRWASPGDPYRYDEYHRKDIKAENICFADSVWFNVSQMPESQVKRKFPAPYYKIQENKAIPLMGNYVDDLIKVKKEGVLKARKIIID